MPHTSSPTVDGRHAPVRRSTCWRAYVPAALGRAKEELAEMEPLLRADEEGAVFEPWDWWYYAEKVRKQKYDLDEEMLRPYFSLQNVQNGVFFLANRLYGITFRPIAVPVYHADATAYEVLDADGSHLAVLYFDFFPAAASRAARGAAATHRAALRERRARGLRC